MSIAIQKYKLLDFSVKPLQFIFNVKMIETIEQKYQNFK
jgi:hypothetical protein